MNRLLRSPRPFRRLLQSAVVPGLLVAALGGPLACGPTEPPPAPGPPIVLITFEGLPAASVGPETTPSLHAFFEEADWSGWGVASSGTARPAGASLVTGLNPWRHRVLLPGDALAPRFHTLAEALTELGYTTSGYFGGALAGPHGFQQGFGFFRTLLRGRGAQSHLRSLRGEPELVWVHLQHPSPPWLRRDWLFPEGNVPAGLPRRVDPADLAPWQSPDAEPPAARREIFEALYRNNVALADVLLGRLLQHLRDSGHWDEAVVAVTSTHGQELGGTRGDPVAGPLSRRLLEVPLALKLSQGGRSSPALRLAVERGDRVAAARLFATLLEIAGGHPAPGVAPSLFEPLAPEGILSEASLEGAPAGALAGVHRVSWLHGNHQLLWTLAGVSTHPERDLLLLRWLGDGQDAAVPIDDPTAQQRLAGELRRAWAEFVPAESSPARRLAP